MTQVVFKPVAVNNAGQAAYWHLAIGDQAAAEFNYLWHQYGRLENIWAALQDWLDASPEERFAVSHKLWSFNPMVLDALWTTLLVGLTAFGDKRSKSGAEPIGIPAWMDRHASIFPNGSETVRLQVVAGIDDVLQRIKKLRNTHLAHWDSATVAKGGFAVHRDQVTTALGQVEHSFRLIGGCFAKDHLMDPPPFNHFGGMRNYIDAVVSRSGDPND